jgi:NADPH:quinone reductase
MKAIRVNRCGGPEVLSYEDIEIGPLGPNEVRVRNRAIGVSVCRWPMERSLARG